MLILPTVYLDLTLTVLVFVLILVLVVQTAESRRDKSSSRFGARILKRISTLISTAVRCLTDWLFLDLLLDKHCKVCFIAKRC